MKQILKKKKLMYFKNMFLFVCTFQNIFEECKLVENKREKPMKKRGKRHTFMRRFINDVFVIFSIPYRLEGTG